MSDLGTVQALDFDVLEVADDKKKKAIEDWPLWVQVGAMWVEKALAQAGIDIDINPASPTEYLDAIIAKVQASPSLGWGKFLALAALKWIRSHVTPDKKLFTKFAKYAKGGTGSMMA